MKRATVLLLGAIVPTLLVACTTGQVSIGRQNKASQAPDGSTGDATGTAGSDTIGCNRALSFGRDGARSGGAPLHPNARRPHFHEPLVAAAAAG
jgi:hypothetical protein